MRNKLFILMGLTTCLACSQKSHNNRYVPMSIMKKNKVYMKEGIILNVRPQTGKLIAKDSVIFFDTSCILLGVGNNISYLLVHSEFDPNNLPVPFSTSFYKSKGLNLFLTNEAADSLKLKSDIPIWVERMHDLIYAYLNNVNLRNLAFLERLKLTYLMLENVEFSDRNTVINSIAKMKTLEFLISDDVFTQPELDTLQTKLPNLAILTSASYHKKLENSELRFPLFTYEK